MRKFPSRLSIMSSAAVFVCMLVGIASAQTSSSFNYDTHPPNRFAFSTTAASPQFPSPSACVQNYGFACYTPAEIRTGYNIPSDLLGTGQSIIIVDAYGSPTLQKDLQVFDGTFGLPAAKLNIYYPGGSPTFNPLQNHNESNWAFETTLDVEWAHAIAPQATINLVIAANNGGNVLNNAVQYAIQNHLGSVMSLSWGSAEAAIAGGGNNTQLQQAEQNFAAARAAGITVFASAGDYGATNGGSTVNALYPASSPNVTAVGGTNLFLSDAGAYQSENVWNDADACPFGCAAGAVGATGGAPSRIFAAPSYQAGLTGNAMRTTADVAYNASVYTAVMTYFSATGSPGYYFTGGTSEGAPQWAAITALANQAAGHALGFLNPALYSIYGGKRHNNDFQDVVSGDNGFFGPGFSAGVGYDIPTGIGSPDVSRLINDLIR